ncbi:hypothetical protein [Ammoniphilus resinae]|uniref:Uncharacterized protein n=1 Tax=Ammoniphilus resinae TaxID=861532 RepID=A0ABS4GQ71_9BACL|nr:hypothetical protein [Ammoniphilus resinae]MBP1932391.1 hypothetical protein [Ammoniphilus resinae]
MKFWFKTLIVLLLVFGFSLPGSAQNIGQLQVDGTKAKDAKHLVEMSPLILVGWADVPNREYPTGKKVQGREIVNFVQKIDVKQTLKGTASPLIDLLTTGVSPLPDASDPLNHSYPGSVAEGTYVFFLRPVTGTDLYSIVGIWQGLYPFDGGQTVGLEGYSYPDFLNLTAKEIESKIKAYSR